MRQVSGFTSSIKEGLTDLQPNKLVDTTVSELQAKCLEILRREVTNLLMESAKGKLSGPSSTSLTNYVKLLSELKDAEEEELKKLSDEHLKKIVSKE